MTVPIGRVGKAYVEVVGEYDHFRKEAEQKINAALKSVARNLDFDPIEAAAAKAGHDSGVAFHKSFESENRNTFRRSATNAVLDFAEELDSPRSRGRLRNTLTRLGRFASGIFGGAFAILSTGSKGFGEFVQTFAKGSGLLESLGFAFTKAGSGIGSFLITAGALLIVIPLIVGPIMTLLSQLVGLLGLLNALPAATAVAVGAVLPLIVAFEGFGAALGAVLENDPDKLTEALKRLTPAARAVVKEIKALLPTFTEIRKAAQEAFFAPIVDSITEFFRVVGAGNISQGFANVAGSIGGLVANLIRLGSTPAFVSLGALLFGDQSKLGAIGEFFRITGPAINSLLTALAVAAETSMPIALDLVKSMAGGIERFAKKIEELSQNGEFNSFLSEAKDTADSLLALLNELLGTFKDIFDETDDGGQRFLDNITKALKDLREWLASPEGKEGMKGMIDFANAFAAVLVGAAATLGKIIEGIIWLRKALGLPGDFTTKEQRGPGKLTPKGQYGKQMAGGGIVTRPTFALVGEAGPEAVVPLNNPQRAKEVLGQAGLLSLAETMGSVLNPIINVFLGDEQIKAILRTEVERGLKIVSRMIFQGVR